MPWAPRISETFDGSVKTLTYPSGKVITYTPDAAGRMLSAIDSGSAINYVTGATYGPDGAITSFISGSGGAAAITNSFSYNKRLQPCRMTASTAGLPLNSADTNPSNRGNVYDITYDFHLGNGTTGMDNGNPSASPQDRLGASSTTRTPRATRASPTMR